jgi:hypothetical protein
MSRDTLKFEKQTVDGEDRIAVYVNGRWKEDCEISSQFSEKEIREHYRQKYLKLFVFEFPLRKELK